MPCKSTSRAFFPYLDSIEDPKDLSRFLEKTLLFERQVIKVGKAKHPLDQERTIRYGLGIWQSRIPNLRGWGGSFSGL
ncbi:hypothetical protein TWF128_009720 [Orbilia oligospora]|nr:hypothetical protein TWF128_009720 [Orbilia oligospora]